MPARLNPTLAKKLHETRRFVREKIVQGALSDREKRQGNRKEDPRNRLLGSGPDFDDPDPLGSARYLPAWERYSGRFFGELTGCPWTRAWTEGVRTIILSGLYGFLLPCEPIQNYSVHLADRFDGTADGLLTHWKPVLTETLLALIDRYQVGCLVDLLSEEVYQEAIDWPAIYYFNPPAERILFEE